MGWKWMGKILELIDWVKKKLKRGETQSQQTQSSKITIVRRTDADSLPSRPSDGGRITIGTIHNNTASGGFHSEVPVENPNLGGGIHVARRRKPGTCPMCRSTGTVIENPGRRPKWKCSACDYTFN